METSEKINILLVDDRPENLFSLEAVLDRDEYQLIKANSGEEALKFLLKHDFAAILLDVQMPGMDGFGTAKIIKAREKTKHIPILFITANNMDTQHIFMGYSVGAIDYILKPIDPLILIAKVERFVEIYKMKKKLMQQAEELASRNKMIEHLAFHDSLTDLPNRKMFNNVFLTSLQEARTMNKPMGIMYLDLDRFKYVNDALGHFIGDKLLEQVAKRLKEHIRTEDFLARISGDEFSIILPDTDRESALDIAEEILEAFKSPFYVDSYELSMTACIGLCIFPYDGEDSVTLIKNVDAALYRAKEQGKNSYKVFHSGLGIQSYRTFLIQNDLHKAIDNDEYRLVYQPRVDVETNRVTSVEALIRWNNPNWGVLLPNEFIPIAEETGHIVEIGEWVFKKVCEQLNVWNSKGQPPIRIAVNLSAQQFLQKNLIDFITKTMSNYNIDPQWIEIEITESVLLGNEDIVTQSLTKLRETGIKISLDDFGIGYSSLNYLRRFPFDTIKIDKSFIDEITLDKNNSLAIIRSIISLANNLDMTVVAEGVETEEQFNIIRQLKCHEVQGYFFSPPLYIADFEAYVIKQNTKKVIEQDIIKTEPESIILSNTSLNKDFLPKNRPETEILLLALDRMKDLYSISSREMDVFKLVIDGLTNKEISEKLFISEHTVKNHITKIFQKLNVTDRVQTIALVYQTCLTETESYSYK